MGKIAFVFPGQGAQSPGMGQSLYENNAAAKRVFDELEALRPGTLALCFQGTAEDLSETRNTQPALFACETAAAAALLDAGIAPDALAGFSLGEVAALGFSGLCDRATAFSLVCRRGILMQEDAERADSAMAAVLKLDNETVEALCAQFSAVYPVNYNCPGQVSIACARAQLADFTAAVKAAGGRALPLKVRGGFHSVFMQRAAAAFREDLAACHFAPQARLPLYSNVTAQPYAGDPAALLARQIESPVRWEALVRNLLAAGVDSFFEVGPGGVLSGLIKKIDAGPRCFSVSTAEDLALAVKEFGLC